MQISKYIDHTILRNTTTVADVEKLCTEAMDYGFKAVCVPPYYVADARRILEGSVVKLATVIGFPFGYQSYRVKVIEASQALEDGADELDMVINLAAFRSNDMAYVENEVKEISALTGGADKVLKIIIESGILTDEEIVKCCELYQHFPVDFIKTSTGYAEKGATLDAVKLIRAHLPSSIQIKASGGIKTFEFARQLIEAGATRIGCSASVAIVKEAEKSL